MPHIQAPSPDENMALGPLLRTHHFGTQQVALITLLLSMICALCHYAQSQRQDYHSLWLPLSCDLVSLIVVALSFWLVGRAGFALYTNGLVAHSPLGKRVILWDEIRFVRRQEKRTIQNGVEHFRLRLFLTTVRGATVTLSNTFGCDLAELNTLLDRIVPRLINEAFEKLRQNQPLQLGPLTLQNETLLLPASWGRKKMVPLQGIQDLRLKQGCYYFIDTKGKCLGKIPQAEIPNYFVMEEFFKQYFTAMETKKSGG